ncbi:MAG: hypothetical protein IPP47_15820 [Bryobacterales bacterium]|nr:hypothetical protein [Bryobacterales bacterium]
MLHLERIGAKQIRMVAGTSTDSVKSFTVTPSSRAGNRDQQRHSQRRLVTAVRFEAPVLARL